MTLLFTVLAVQLALSPGPRACIEKRLRALTLQFLLACSIAHHLCRMLLRLGVTKAKLHPTHCVSFPGQNRSRDEVF